MESLVLLPLDQLLYLFSDWSFQEIREFSSINKAFQERICQNPEFWSIKFFNDLGTVMPQIVPFDFRMYRQLYYQQKRQNQLDSLFEIYIKGMPKSEKYLPSLTGIVEIDRVLEERLLDGWQKQLWYATHFDDYQGFVSDPQKLVSIIRKYYYFLPTSLQNVIYSIDSDFRVLVALNEVTRPARELLEIYRNRV